MNELNSSMEESDLKKTLKKLEILEAEKDDIVLGFIKEKEIIEAIHQEQLEQLKVKYEDEIQALRQDWSEEREKLLRESDSRQMDAESHNKRKTKEIEEKLRKKSQEDVKETEEEFRVEKRKLREEYETVISQKTSEIEELYRENCILRAKSDPGSFEDKHKESQILSNKLQNKIAALEEEKLTEIMKLKNDFELEKAELEREQIREKAEFVKRLTSKYEQQNTNNEVEKNESFLAYKKEMKEKIEIVEKLWEERNTEDRKKMNTRLEKEIETQKERFADELRAQLFEKDMEIEELERDKEDLSNSVHAERFELAKAFNRELSILNRLDSPTKEDIEVALIDEVAKLRDEQQKVIRSLEKRHKRKMRDLKKSQKPLAEIEEQHKNELEELRNNFEREKEEFEAKLRTEQLNILKSFEFEKNDLERYYQQHMEEQESEFQNEMQALQCEYEKAENKLAALEKENEELKNQVVQEKERNGELFDKLQECESKNARLKEELEKDKRNMREPVKEVCVAENDNESIKQTVEKLSSLNVQLSDELERERKKCENLLEKIHELEKERECLMIQSEADEVQSSESGLELLTSPTEKPGRPTRESDSNTDGSSVEEKKSGGPKKVSEPSQEDLDMQMKLQDSVQEYLMEIKVLQNAMDEKEMEMKQLKDTFSKEKSDLMEQIQELTDSLKNAVADEDAGADEEEDIDELKSRYKKLTDSINQAIKDLAEKPSISEASQTCDPEPSHQQKGFANEMKALDEVLSDEMDPGVKERLGKKLEAIKNSITRSHELEKLEQQRKHEQVKNRYLKELSEERNKELDVSSEVWEAVCEKLGIEQEEGKDKPKEMLGEKDGGSDSASQKIEPEIKGKSNDDDGKEMEAKEEKWPDSEELQDLKGENESLRCALKELDKHYQKDKEELLEKLHTQHKEFVLSSEAEVIEKLLKIKSALEEEVAIERFYLGRIYYSEMQDELEEILSKRKEDMDKEHEKEKLTIVLKFSKDVADLHKVLADKDENELKLLEEKNALAKKVLNMQRRMPENEKDENNNTDDIQAEAKKLEASLPLKKELADLQRQRQGEHEAGVQNLEKALDLIKDILNDQNKSDEFQHRRNSFERASSQSDGNVGTESPACQKSPTSQVQEYVLSEEEIRTKEDLQKALEDLIDNCLSKEKDDAESDTSSGASSDFDFESEPNTPPCEGEEGVSDSGAESIENECVSLKKADLEMAMNLERFGLSRLYYNELKDSLESALKKLDKFKKKNQDLEDKLSRGVKDLVDRTVFGKMMVQTVDMHTQTLEMDDPVNKNFDDLSECEQKDIPMHTSANVPEHGDVKEDKVDEHLKQNSTSNAIADVTVKKEVGTQTDGLQDSTKTTKHTDERPDDKENMVQDSIKGFSKKDATTQTDGLQDYMEDAKEANKEIEDKHDHEIKDAIPQKQDDFPINEENKNQRQSEDVSSKALPQKEKGIAGKLDDEREDEISQKHDGVPSDAENNQKQSEVFPQKEKGSKDEIVESVCEPVPSHMLGQEAPEKETEGKEKENTVDSKDKDTEKKDREQEQVAADGEEKLFDEDKQSTNAKGKAKKEEEATPDEKPEGTTNADQSDTSDEQDQILKDQARTSNGEGPEANSQLTDKSDVENEKLKDKFDILKALVGKWFVDEIPELRSQNEGDSRSNDLGEDELKKLREEERSLAEEIKAIDKELLQLKDMNDANIKKEEEKLNEQELLALKQFEKADQALKKEEEKDLIELLEKEKEEVDKKLKELEVEIKEHEDQISDDEKRLFNLMSKKLELEEGVALQARELDKNQKKLAQMKDDSEMAKLDEAVLSLEEQKKILEELLATPLSADAQEESPPLNKQLSRVSDEDERTKLPPNEAHIPPHVKELVKAKESEEKKMRNLAKNIEKAKRDKNRYNRMAKDREERLKPFIRKREQLQKRCKEEERTAGEKDKDEVLSTSEESITPEEIPEEKAMADFKVEDIKRELKQIRDELSLLGEKAKIPSAMGTQTNALQSKLNDLESQKDMIDQQITEKQSKIENLGTSQEAAEVFELLEAKAKLDVKRLNLQEAFPEGYQELPQEVQEAYELACLKQEVQNGLDALNQEMQREENNFKESVIYQRQGKMDDPRSTIGPMLTRLQNLSLELESIPSSLPYEDEAALASDEAAQREYEDQRKRIKEIQDLLRQNEDSMKDEPLRAAGELEKLIENKQNKTNELLKVSDALKEKIKMAEFKENELQNIPESVQSAISLEKETDEEADLSFEEVERENDIKERCFELQSLKNKGEDTRQKEDELLDLIQKQDPMLKSDERQKSKVFDTLPASVFADNKAVTSELENIDEKLKAVLDSQNEKKDLMSELNDLGSLFQQKAEIDQSIKYHEHFDDLLNQERKLAEALKTAVNKKELDEIEQIIERKEKEIEKIKAKNHEVEEMLEQLNGAKTNNEESDDKLILDIQEAFKETEQHLLEAQAEKERYYQSNNKEEIKVKEAMSSLEDEMEEKREEMEFVENELEGLRSMSEDDSANSPELDELTNLLNSKKTLKDYLLEIDTKLEDCDESTKPSLSQEEMQTLKDEKSDAKRKLKEIQEQKSKFEVELQDEDIQENYDSLCEEKSRLEQAQNELLHKIHGSNVFVQMADDLDEEEPSEDEQKYYTQALNQMLSDQKTLIKLAQENEKLKDASCRQRDLLENLNNSISASLGEDLAKAITLGTNVEEKGNLQLPTAIMDRINEKDKTITEILNELENENKNLTTLNEDLSNELDCLREKIGETLSDAILESNNQLLEEKLMPTIDEVLSADKTVEEILEEQKDGLERLKDVIGKDLTSTLLKPRKDIREIDDENEPLKAPKIMNETDDDLQTVIAAYEFKLDNLDKENDVLKSMLGNDLVRALLDVNQDGIIKPIAECDNVIAEKGKIHLEDEEGLEASKVDQETKEMIQRPFDTDEETKLESEARKQQLSTKLEPRQRSENADEIAAIGEYMPQETEGGVLLSSLKHEAPTTSQETFTESPDSPKQVFPESNAVKHGISAPTRMVKDHKTLGEVIRDYEDELDTLKFRLGPYLYKEIIDAGVPDKDEDEGCFLTEESEIQPKETGKPLDDTAIYEEASKEDSSSAKGDVSYDNEKGANEETREQREKIEGKQEIMPSDTDSTKIEGNVLKEKQKGKVAEDNRRDGSLSTEEKTLSPHVTEKEDMQPKPQKTALAAPKKMIDENQSLEEIIEGYENDLETLKSCLGQELFRDILDVGKKYNAPGGSEVKSEEEERRSYLEEPSDIVATQEGRDDTQVSCESNDKADDLPSLKTKIPFLQGQSDKQENKPDGLDQAQLAANANGQAYEFKETRPIPDAEKICIPNDGNLKAPASDAEQEENREIKAKQPSIDAPKRMIEENQTLAEVVGGYENDLDILKSRLGPGLYDKILDAGKIDSTDLRLLEKKAVDLEEDKQPETFGKPTDDKTGDADRQDKKESKERERMPYEGVFHGQDKTSKIDDLSTTESCDDAEVSSISEERRDLAHEPAPLMGASKAQGGKVEIYAPKQMIEDNKTLENVIKDYERDLETLKSKLGPQLFTCLLDTSTLGDEHDEEESYGKPQRDKGFREKQPSKIRNDEGKFVDDLMEEVDEYLDQEAVQGKDQEKDLETTLSEGETYLSDGELYESFNIPDIKEEGTENKPGVRFSAPTIMSKEGKTLGEMLESYETDLEALKTKLGPNLFDCVLNIAKVDGEQATAGMAKENDVSLTQIPTKQLRTEELTHPDYKKAVGDNDAKEDSAVDIDNQVKSADDERNGGDKENTGTGEDDDDELKGDKDHLEKSLESKRRSMVISNDTDDSESLSKDCDLAAPKQMSKENKTLEEIIANYENDLRDLRESLGPQLCGAILSARKGIYRISDGEAVALERGECERERDYLEQTTDEKGEKAGSLRTEISRVVSESRPQEEFENAHGKVKDKDGESSETKPDRNNQSEQEVKEEERENTSDFDRDIEDQQQAKQRSMTQQLQAPKMIAQGKKLDEIVCGYENELGALKSRIGPRLYEDIVNAGKPDKSNEREQILDRKNLEGMDKIQVSDEDLKETKDENTKVDYEEDKEKEEKEERPSASDFISKPDHKRAVEDIDAKKDSAVDIDTHAKGADDEIKGGDKEHARTDTHDGELKEGETEDHPEKGLESMRRSIAMSTNTDDTESLSNDCDLVAPKQMLKEKKTLEEIISKYENDLRDLRESLGPQLCDAILNARKGINRISDAETVVLEKEESERERDYLEQTADEKGEKAGNLKTEISRVVSESHPQEEFENACDKVKDKDGESSETKPDRNNQSEQEVQEEEGEDTSDFDKDIEDQQQAKQRSMTQQLQAPKMIAQGKKLDEIVCGYENELGALKSRIGPRLYEDIVNAGKPDKSYEREQILDRKNLEGMDKIQVSDEDLKETKDENTKVDYEEDKEKEERPSASDFISKKTKGGTKEEISAKDPERNTKGGFEEYKRNEERISAEDAEGQTEDEAREVTSTEHLDYRNAIEQKAKKEQEGDQEQEEDISSGENNIDSLQMKAGKEMLSKNKTLEEIVQGYEEDLATLNCKLGPELYQLVLETGSKDYKTKPSDKESAFDDGSSESMQDKKEIGSPDDDIQIEYKIEDIIQESSDKQEQIFGKVAQQQGEEASPEKAVDQKSQTENSAGEIQDSIELSEKETKSSPSFKTKLKAPILLAEEGTTLQKVIEKYEEDLDAFSSRLGPNLTKAVVEARGKKIKGKDDRDDLLVKQEDQNINKNMKDEIMKTGSIELNSNLDEVTYDNPIAEDEFQSDDKENTRKAAEETEKQQEMDYYSDIFENDMTLEDAMNKLKKESEDLKQKLGPNLTKILLEEQVENLSGEGREKEKEIGHSGTKNIELSDTDFEQQNEGKEMTKTAKGKEKKRKLETESNHVKWTEDTSEEQRQAEDEDKKEKSEKKSDKEESKEQEEEGAEEEDSFDQQELHESEELAQIVSPLLNGDENNSLEDILKNMHKDLDVLTSKLGSNLSKSLLTMDEDSYDVSKEKYLDNGGEEKASENKDESETLSEKMEEREARTIFSEPEEKGDDKLGTESAVEEPNVLAALDQMEESSQTLEEVIKKYENNLERYESCLGPYLSEAILNKEITQIKTAQQSQAKHDLDDNKVEQDVPLREEDDKMKRSKLEEYLKLLDEGKTLEDMLISYDPEDEVIITDESGPTDDQMKRLQKQNGLLKHELENLKSQLGEALVSQLQPKGTDGKSPEQHDKETSKDDVTKIGDDKLCLEAPKMMFKDNRTLEDIVAEYENELKEKTKIREDLEQSIGPHLFKELCELRRQEGEEGDFAEEKSGPKREEKQEKTQSEKLQSKYDAVNKMVEEKKNLETVLDDNENKLEALERENASLKNALENVSGDGTNLGEIISKYENQITILENAKKEAENEFEDKHNELQNEIDDLRATLEKLAQTLRQDFLDDLMKQESDNHIEALQIMEKENKTLAEVVEEYEENMKNLEREKAVLQQIAGQDEEGASMLDTINDYEDAIKGLKEVNKVLNKRMDLLTEKLGPQLTKQITDLCDEATPSKTSEKDDRTKEDMETLGAVKEMEDKNMTLEEVLKMYDDHNKREIASLDKTNQTKPPEKGEKEVKAQDERNNNENQHDPIETLSTLQTEDVAAGLLSDALCERIGLQLIGDIKQLDNKSYEELEEEDKRPYALRTMKAKNEQLQDIIEAYENTLSKYGLLDSSTLKGESLAAELQAATEADIKVEEEVLFGEQAPSEVASESTKKDKENDDAQGNDDGQQIKMLKKELEKEKALKEKYQKNAEDLLNDIIKLKMKNADGEEVDKEDIEKQIKEEYEQKQENKHLKDDLSKEKEKSKDLEYENNELKDEIRNMEKEIKNLEKAIEKMQASSPGLLDDGDVDGRIKDLLVKNENLEKELETLKTQMKENEESYKNEKNNLMEQFDKEKRDTIKSLLDAKAEVEIKLQEQLALYHELEEKLKSIPEELDRSTSNGSKEAADNKEAEGTSEEDEDKLAELRMRNESLKETLDLSEESMKDALQKYQEEIKALEVGKAKMEDDKNHEIELLNNKLELEKAALERLKSDYDEMLKKEKDRQMEDFEKDLEREKRRSRKDLEEQSDDFERKQNLHKQDLQDANKKADKEKEELRNSLEDEIEKLRKMFEEQMRQKDEEHEKVLNKLREQLEDQMITEKAEMNVQFRQEKTELKTQIEKNIYGDELQKNIDLENDFQETLNKMLKDHANEIAEIEKEMAKEEERFRDLKLQLQKEFENDKLKETEQHEKEKQDMESTIENLLKEIIKLKHQRKEMRHQYRVEKQSIDEISEKERIEIQENMERSKTELVTKLKEDHEKEMEVEKGKYEAVIKELQEALDRAEAKKKELEEKLRNESLKAEESLNNKSVDEASTREITREVKVIKRGIEIEYEQKLSIEKQRFEDTLQGLRREVGNLQEKRKIIQERVYNQETHSSERQFIEKSIANYKLEVLSKLEAEMAQRIERERKPLEEEVRELQIENEELKHQRWELKAQFRREKAALEEEFEREKEALENNLNKEKEELRKRLEASLQKEKLNKAFDHIKASRSTSPVPGESSPRIDNTVRMLKQENLSLVSQNAKHEIEIEQLSEKLKLMEMNFQEMMETEKLKAEKMKKIQEQIPKVETVDPTFPAPKYKPPSTGAHDDTILHSLQEKDQQIHQLLETKKYYESVLSELCDEAGLFELDRNQIV